MVKSKNGGNKDGLGVYEMVKLAIWHPVYFTLVLFVLRVHLSGLARRILGVH